MSNLLYIDSCSISSKEIIVMDEDVLARISRYLNVASASKSARKPEQESA